MSTFSEKKMISKVLDVCLTENKICMNIPLILSEPMISNLNSCYHLYFYEHF